MVYTASSHPHTHTYARALCHTFRKHVHSSHPSQSTVTGTWLSILIGEVGGEATAAWYTPEGEFNSEIEEHEEIEDVDGRKQEMWYSMRLHSSWINSLLWWFILREVSVGSQKRVGALAPQYRQWISGTTDNTKVSANSNIYSQVSPILKFCKEVAERTVPTIITLS